MKYIPHEAVRTHPFDYGSSLTGMEVSFVRKWVITRLRPGWFISHTGKSFVATVKWDLITHYGFSEESFR